MAIEKSELFTSVNEPLTSIYKLTASIVYLLVCGYNSHMTINYQLSTTIYYQLLTTSRKKQLSC